MEASSKSTVFTYSFNENNKGTIWNCELFYRVKGCFLVRTTTIKAFVNVTTGVRHLSFLSLRKRRKNKELLTSLGCLPVGATVK